MVQTQTIGEIEVIKNSLPFLTFDDYIEQYPEDRAKYELINGKIIKKMRPIGRHEKIGGFLMGNFFLQINQYQLPYFIPTSASVKTKDGESSYIPDVIVLDENEIRQDSYWEKYSSVSLGNSIKLIVEIVSNNWQDDYLKKLHDYEILGITEYWIVDYLAKGASRYIGNPKQPTISIYNFKDREYQVKLFQGNEKIISSIFPELNLTVEKIFTII
jgi:Uma2 family endonuclease